MSGDNGNGNGKIGGVGGQRGTRLKDKYDLGILRQALGNGWPVGAEALAKVAATMLATLDDPKASRRDKNAAARVLTSVYAQNAQLFEMLDKQRRLDQGDPTDIVRESYEVEFDRLG